jgi:hypothetical protein
VQDLHEAGREQVNAKEAEIVALAEAGGDEFAFGLGWGWVFRGTVSTW